MNNKGKHESSSVTQALAYGLIGLTSKILVSPFERLKIVQQCSTRSLTLSEAVQLCTHGPINSSSNNGGSGSGGSIAGLWKGSVMQLVRIAANMTASSLSSLLPVIGAYHRNKRNMLSTVIIGSIAGAATFTLLHPFELVNARYMSDTGSRYSGYLDCMLQTYEEGGVPAFFVGYGTGLFSLVVYRVLYVGLFETVRTFVQLRTIAPLKRALLSEMIGLVCVSTTHQLDTIRKFAMVRGTSVQQAADSLYEMEGFWNGFYRGYGANLMRGMLGDLAIRLMELIVEKVQF